MAPPLAANSELPIGYGSADAKAFNMEAKDVAFLRLFVSTKHVDLSVLEQSSIFFHGNDLKVKSPVGVVDGRKSTTEKVKSHRSPASGSGNGDKSRGGGRQKLHPDIWDIWTYVLQWVGCGKLESR
jgi:hypothetical protein